MRRRLVIMCWVLITVSAVPLIAVAEEDAKPLLGKYSCVVKSAHLDEIRPDHNSLPKHIVGSRLEYDADAGVMTIATKMKIDGKESWLPPQDWCRDLQVETYPSRENNLHAVQYVPVSESARGYMLPFVAWLTIKTLDSETTPEFMFFSTGIQGVVAGKCTHL